MIAGEVDMLVVDKRILEGRDLVDKRILGEGRDLVDKRILG